MNNFRNTHGNRRKANNSIEVPLLGQWLVIFFAIGLAGLFFVYLKNQQHALGEQTRLVEQKLVDLRAHNDALVARVMALTSRGALQRQLGEKYLDLVQIPETAIARITPAAASQDDKVLRTASLSTHHE